MRLKLYFLFIAIVLLVGLVTFSTAVSPDNCPYPILCWTNGTSASDTVAMNLNVETGDLNITGSLFAAGGISGGNLTGSGTANYLSVWTSGTVLGDSVLNQSNGNLFTAGNITAVSFLGDGSQLTGISGGGNITGGGSAGLIAEFTNASNVQGVNETTLNVNKSSYWDDLNSPSDITGLNEDNINSENFTVNKSLYWDDLDSPSDITSLGTLTTLNVSGGVQALNFSGGLNWTYLQEYPAACASGTFVSANDDSNTCTAPVAADVDPGTYPSGNYVYQGEVNATCIRFPNNSSIGSGC